MLTRLKVSGFKNLVDVDVRFGPFTCIAGTNGVGKSNLFDAIRFLSALADRPLIQAAMSVRDDNDDDGRRTMDVRALFRRVEDEYATEMRFEAEMIVPSEAVDDLGQTAKVGHESDKSGQSAKASITFLRYTVALAYHVDDGLRPAGSLELLEEKLVHISQGDAAKHLLFEHSPDWRKSAVIGARRAPSFISTEDDGAGRIIKLHQDGGSRGKPMPHLASSLPRTVVSAAYAAESPTALLARREMQSWRLLQLEPSELRKPDKFTSPTRLGTDGAHLAATLYHLAQVNRQSASVGGSDSGRGDAAEAQTYAEVANRLTDLIQDVNDVWIDRDDKQELLSLQVKGRDGTSHPARALSDGTLRFLALAVLQLDPEAQGVLCLEEPENGIHPGRIEAMLELLQDIVTDVQEPIGPGNPLRQVIINTHSPSVVLQVPEDSLLVAETRQAVLEGKRFKKVCFRGLANTWRSKEPGAHVVSLGQLLGYLEPSAPDWTEVNLRQRGRRARVMDRLDIQQLRLPLDMAAGAPE